MDVDCLSTTAATVHTLVPCGACPIAAGYRAGCRRCKGPHKSGAEVCRALGPLESQGTVILFQLLVVFMQDSEVRVQDPIVGRCTKDLRT